MISPSESTPTPQYCDSDLIILGNFSLRGHESRAPSNLPTYVSLEEMCSEPLVPTGWYASVGLDIGHLTRFSGAAKYTICCKPPAYAVYGVDPGL